MPLRFSDLPALGISGNTYHEALQQNWDPNDNAQRKFQAQQNELDRQQTMEAADATHASAAQIQLLKNNAESAKGLTEARRKFMERVSEATRRGDMEGIRALSIEAPQYGLSIDERGDIGELETTPSQLEEPGQLNTGIKGYGEDLTVGAPKGELNVDAGLLDDKVKKAPQFMMSIDGTNMPLDVLGARKRNQDQVRKTYGNYLAGSRPQDMKANKQAVDVALALNLPIEEASKIIAMESPHERLQRETSEENQRAALGERRAEFGMTMEQRTGEHEDKMGMQQETLELQKGSAGQREQSNASRIAKTWNDAAMKTAKDLDVLQYRKTQKKAAYALRMLKDANLVEGASPDKTQIIAIGNVAQLAQPDDNRLSNADRDALTNSFGVINNIYNKISMGKDATLSAGEIAGLENALAKVAKITNDQQVSAFEEMATARMGLIPEASDQYDRVINVLFGQRPDFDELAERNGVRKYKGAATPIPSSDAPAQPVVDEEELSKQLEEAGF